MKKFIIIVMCVGMLGLVIWRKNAILINFNTLCGILEQLALGIVASVIATWMFKGGKGS
ncbi:hypothetical protein [Bacillus pacificus]|uniref:hypothetical protein n=1 Tax=Bacillus pacificus TaxID=2026187 RepID=UPI001E2E8375|nr:hypothetical protein [Bacillus pacificus]MCC2390622.1 hypothetical protein [Bacillus pacificus]